MLLFRESYREEGTYSGSVNSIEEWIQITGADYKTPQLRQVRTAIEGRDVEVYVPLVPARAKNRNEYIEEFKDAGFGVEKFEEMKTSASIAYSASIYIRKAGN